MNFHQFVSVIRARWVMVLLAGIIAMVTAFIVSSFLPKKYTAQATVIVDFKADPIAGALYGSTMSPAVIATQVDILQSDRVARRVVSDLKLDQNASVRQQWIDATGGRGTLADWLTPTLQSQLDVVPSRESNVITVGYKSQDPAAAAAFANAFVQAFMETAVELRVDPAKEYSGFFDQRIKDARARLLEAQSAYGNFQRDNGITGSDEQLDVETTRLNELSGQLVAVQTLAGDTTSRRNQADSGNASNLQETMNSPVITSLKLDLSRAEATLEQLTSKYGANYPQVAETKANIAELRSRIDSETRRISSSVGVSADINVARVGALRAAIEEQRAKVLKLKAARDQLSVLARDVESAQRDYDAIGTRASQTSLESQTQQSNINPLSRATAPSSPSSPRILLNTGAALVLGLFFGLALAFARELLDRRVRVGDDITMGLGLPILGVLPKPLVTGKHKPGVISLMAQRVISGRLPAPGKSN